MLVQFTPYSAEKDPALTSVIENLRVDDRQELSLFGFYPTEFSTQVRSLAQFSLPDAFLVYLDGQPVFVFGAAQHTPGVCQLWGFGTRQTRKILPALTTFILEDFGPRLFMFGARRVQVLVPINSRRSFQWLNEHLGMRVEYIMSDYCTDGSPMAQLVYTRKDYEEYVQHTKHFRNTSRPSAEGSSSSRASV